jgi:hypothetical protein
MFDNDEDGGMDSSNGYYWLLQYAIKKKERDEFPFT